MENNDKNLIVPAASGEVQRQRKIPLDEMLKEFLSGKSPATRESYQNDMRIFAEFLGAESIDEACQHLFSRSQGEANYLLIQYKNDMLEQKLAPNTINRRLASVRSVVKFANLIGVCSFSTQVSGVKVQKYKDTTGPGRKGVKEIIHAAKDQRKIKKRKRDTAILRLFCDLALRRNEVISLDLQDLDIEGKRIQIIGKGRLEKEWLNCPDVTINAINEWLEVRGDIQTDAVFINLAHNSPSPVRITPRGIYKVIKELGIKVGVKARPHGLRHTSITDAMQKAQAMGFGIEDVMDFSRHKDVNVLMVYRDKIADNQGKIAKLVSEDLE